MKTGLCATLFGTCLSLTAHAQTSLSLYGVADAGVQVSRFGNGTRTNLASGIAEGSRIGFKGTEDLGSGFKAIFTLEARVELDNGGNASGYPTDNAGTALTRGFGTILPAPFVAPITAAVTAGLQPDEIVNPDNAIFDRTSMVGLITPVGAILLGRQYTPGYEIVSMADTYESGTAGGWSNILGGTGGYVTPGIAIRANQAIQYRIQVPSGFGAAVMYGFNETGSLNRSDRFWGANVKYQARGWNVGLGYNNETDQTGNDSLESLTLGGSYALDKLKLFAGYHRMKSENSVLVGELIPLLSTTPAAPFATQLATLVGQNARLDSDSYTVGMQYRIGSGRVLAAIGRTNDKLATDATATLYSLGYNYSLSKRTDLYAIAAHISNENTAQVGLGGAGFAGGFTSEAGKDGSALQLGIRHKF
jgi:general bacterial porin, GBP family